GPHSLHQSLRSLLDLDTHQILTALIPLHGFLLFYKRGDHRDLHSFPTRRSSDLSSGMSEAAQGRSILVTLLDVDTGGVGEPRLRDRKSTRLNSSHVSNSYAVFCLKKKTPSDGRMYAYVCLSPSLSDFRAITITYI